MSGGIAMHALVAIQASAVVKCATVNSGAAARDRSSTRHCLLCRLLQYERVVDAALQRGDWYLAKAILPVE